MRRARILVFDSGLGGLSVFRAIQSLRPDADYLYLADDAGFPYGDLDPETLTARVLATTARALAEFPADALVIACSTASTLVLEPLRARHSIPIIGTVPAIKPASELTRSGLISVLATPGTVARDYTHALIRAHASGCRVTLVGARTLASLCEAHLRGRRVDDEAILSEVAPAFVEESGQRTDTIVLGCTHFPLLLPEIARLAPWGVRYVDPAPAIARRVASLIEALPPRLGMGSIGAEFTSGDPPVGIPEFGEPATQAAPSSITQLVR